MEELNLQHAGGDIAIHGRTHAAARTLLKHCQWARRWGVISLQDRILQHGWTDIAACSDENFAEALGENLTTHGWTDFATRGDENLAEALHGRVSCNTLAVGSDAYSAMALSPYCKTESCNTLAQADSIFGGILQQTGGDIAIHGRRNLVYLHYHQLCKMP